MDSGHLFHYRGLGAPHNSKCWPVQLSQPPNPPQLHLKMKSYSSRPSPRFWQLLPGEPSPGPGGLRCTKWPSEQYLPECSRRLASGRTSGLQPQRQVSLPGLGVCPVRRSTLRTLQTFGRVKRGGDCTFSLVTAANGCQVLTAPGTSISLTLEEEAG